MSLAVFMVVILAALLHASWNALLKSRGDKHLNMLAVVYGQALMGALALPFVEFPAASVWPYLAAGVLLHVGYQVFLTKAYQAGDFTQVYPIARGIAPLLVLFVSVLILGVSLNQAEFLAIALIVAGVLSLCVTRAAQGIWQSHAVLHALLTGCFIAGYSLVDGLGSRVMQSPLGFYAYLSLLNALMMAALQIGRSEYAPSQVYREAKPTLFFGGGASFIAYALVLWAFTQAPIALVTALRESSIIFALVIGVWLLREPLQWRRVLSAMITLSGVMVLRLSRTFN